MKSKVVREIPANPFLRDARKLKKNLRVAAYCRVSTEEEEQQNSPVNTHFLSAWSVEPVAVIIVG